MQPFDYVVPTSLEEASALLLEGNGSVRCLQGGTDLIIRIRGGFVRPERVIDLKSLPGMREIRLSPDGWLVVGAACTMNQVGLHPLVCERYDVLAQGANSVASYQLRNRATIGGNCCNASPAADTAPALLCLDAVAEVFGPDGSRRIPINEFFTGPGRTAMQKGEFLTSIHLPPHSGRSAGSYNKLGRTKIGDISVVSVAVNCLTGEGWPNLADCHRRGRSYATARAERRRQRWSMTFRRRASRAAAELASEAARPIDDIRGSAAYRKAMVRVLTRRGIETVFAALTLAGVPPTAGGQA